MAVPTVASQAVPLAVQLGRPKLHPEGQQSLLGAIVQIALDPPPLGQVRRRDAGQRLARLDRLHADGRPQARILGLGGGLTATDVAGLRSTDWWRSEARGWTSAG